MANYLVGITIKATDQASAVIASVRNPLSAMQVGLKAASDKTADFQNKWGALATTGTRVGTALLAAGTAGVALGAHFTNLASQMQTAQKSFTTLLHSAGLAKQFVGELQEFGAKTPFEFLGLQSQSKQLLAYGFQVKQIIPMMTDLGDAMASLGGGQEELSRVVAGMGKIQTKGRASAEQLNVIAEAGIPAYQILQEELGLTAAEVGKIGERGISADKAIQALLTGMRERFGGAMAAQANTLKGALSNLKDTLDITSAGLGRGLVAPATLGIKALTGILNIVRELPAPIQAIIGTGMTGFAGLTAALGLGGIGAVKLAEGYMGARAAMLAFGETEIGMAIASKALIALNWLQSLSVDGVVASLTAANAAMRLNAGTMGIGAALTSLNTGLTWLYTAANTALTASFAVVATAARIAWAALAGPIGWIVLGVGLIGAAIAGLVIHNRRAKKAAEDRTAADVEGAAAATEADKKAAEAKTEAADAAAKAEQATLDLADAEQSYKRAVEDEPRIQRDVANEIRDAKEAQAEAAQGLIDAEEQAAERITQAQKDIGDAHKEAAKAADDGARSIADAQRKVSDATEQAAERVQAATESAEKAYKREQKAAEKLETAKLKGQERVQAAQDQATERQEQAQKRLQDALNKQAGIEESPEARAAREVAEAQQELAKVQQEGERAVADAKKQATADQLAAEEALANARDEARKAADEALKAQVEGKRAIADAEIALKDAKISAAEAQQKAAERVNEAEKALNKAREENDRAKIDAERRLRDATEAYVRAAEQAPRKLQDAANAIEKAARALAKAKGESAKANEDAQTRKQKASTEQTPEAQDLREWAKRKGGFLAKAAPTGWRSGWSKRKAELAKRVGSEEAEFIASEILKETERRAGGGPVRAGRPYVIGERGPEVFVPGASGYVLSNMAGAGSMRAPAGLTGAGVVNNNTFNFSGNAYGDAAVRQMIREEIKRAMNSALHSPSMA